MAKKFSNSESLALEAAFKAAREAGWTSPVVEVRPGPVFLDGVRIRDAGPPWPSDVGRREYTRRVTVKFRSDGLVVIALRGKVIDYLPGRASVDWRVEWVEARGWNFADSRWGERGGPIPTNAVLSLVGPDLQKIE